MTLKARPRSRIGHFVAILPSPNNVCHRTYRLTQLVARRSLRVETSDGAYVRGRDIVIKRAVGRRTETGQEGSFDTKRFLNTDGGGHTVVKYLTGETVFSQGSPADVVFYVLKGKVKLTVVSEQGKEAVVAYHFFGEGCLTGQLRRLASAVALLDCEIMRLEKAAMVCVLHEEPAFSRFFIDHLLTRSKRTWSINCSIRASGAWHARFYCWRISTREVCLSLSLARSARRRSRGSSAQRDRASASS